MEYVLISSGFSVAANNELTLLTNMEVLVLSLIFCGDLRMKSFSGKKKHLNIHKEYYYNIKDSLLFQTALVVHLV